MRKALIGLALGLVIAVLALAAAVLWLVATPQGLRWALDLAMDQLQVDVAIGRVEGRLLGPLTLEQVRYRGGDGAVVTVGGVEFDWLPQSLFDSILHVRRLAVREVAVQQGSTGAKDPGPVALPEVRLPLAVAIDEAHVTGVRVAGPGAQPPLVIDALRLRGRADQDALIVDTLELRAPDYSLDARGRLTPRGEYPLTVDAEWSLRHPAIAAPLRGRSAVTGTLMRLDTSTRINAPAAATLTVEIAEALSAPRWRGRVRMEPVALTTLNAAWPRWRLGGEVQVAGDLKSTTLDGVIHGENEQWGALSAELDVHWDAPELRVERIHVKRGGAPAALTASGRVAFAEPQRVSFDVRGDWRDIAYPWRGPAEWVTPRGRFQAAGDLDAFTVDVDGMLSAPGAETGELSRIAERVELHAVVDGLRGQPRVKLQAAVPYLRIADYAADSLRADIDLDTTDTQPSRVDVSIAGLQLYGNEITDVQLRGAGRVAGHTLEVKAQREESSLHLAATGAWREPQWSVVVNRFDLRNVLSTDWALSDDGMRLTLARDEVAAQRGCWRVFAGGVCLAGRWRRGAGWGADLDLEALALSALGALWRPEVSWTGSVSGSARLSADAGNVISMRTRLESAEGSATLAAEDKPLELRFRDIRVDANIEGNQLRGAIRAAVVDNGALTGNITLGNVFDGAAAGPLAAALDADFKTLDALRALSPEIGVEGGALDARLTAGGTLARPTVKVSARIFDAALAVPQAGTRLEDIGIQLESVDDATVALTASARAGDGVLQASGTSQFIDANNWNLGLKIKGSKLQALKLPEATVIATPDLEIRLQPGRIDLGGVVSIDEAVISPELASGAGVTLSPDVVIIEQDTAPPAAMETHAGIRVDLGDQVSFSGYGLSGKLRGGVDLVQVPARAIRATGEITIADGVYSLYGRTLNISTGRLIFAGGAIDNPGIDARAERTIDDVTVTASLRGTLRQPEFSLTSTPAMSDTDMLSYLVLGRPANQVGGGDATLLLDAASSLLPRGGGVGVTDRIKSAFGLETLTVETRTNAEEETRETSLVLGRYLTPRLYIAYAAGVANTLNVFRVRYQLTKRWLLQTESSSEESGGDVLFKIER